MTSSAVRLSGYPGNRSAWHRSSTPGEGRGEWTEIFPAAGWEAKQTGTLGVLETGTLVVLEMGTLGVLETGTSGILETSGFLEILEGEEIFCCN